MIVFLVFIKFWSSRRNTENTITLLFLNEESDHFEENACKNEVCRSTVLYHRKKLNIRLSCRFITYGIRIGYIDWCKCQKQPLEVFCKNVFFKFRKIYRNTGARESTCEFCEIFKNTSFTEKLRTTASEMLTLQKRSKGNILP